MEQREASGFICRTAAKRRHRCRYACGAPAPARRGGARPGRVVGTGDAERRQQFRRRDAATLRALGVGARPSGSHSLGRSSDKHGVAVRCACPRAAEADRVARNGDIWTRRAPRFRHRWVPRVRRRARTRLARHRRPSSRLRARRAAGAAVTSGERYRARVRIRRGILPVKPEAEPLDGREVEVEAGWPLMNDGQIDETRGGIYRDEWAMLLPRDWPLLWIASGDLEFLGGELSGRNGRECSQCSGSGTYLRPGDPPSLMQICARCVGTGKIAPAARVT